MLKDTDRQPSVGLERSPDNDDGGLDECHTGKSEPEPTASDSQDKFLTGGIADIVKWSTKPDGSATLWLKFTIFALLYQPILVITRPRGYG